MRVKKNQSGVSHHFLLPVLAVLAVGGIGYYMLTMSDAAVVPGDPNGTQARRAYDFVDSQGVIAHVDQDSYTNKDTVLNSLKYVKIRNVRTSYTEDATVRRWLASKGVKFHYTTLTPGRQPLSQNPSQVDASATSRVSDITTRPSTGNKYAKSTVSVEPYNEYNKKDDLDNDWTETALRIQQQLWSKKSQLAAHNPKVKILGPSLVGYNSADATAQLASKDLSRYMDYGNVHSYYGGETPETNLETNDGFNGFVTSNPPAASRSLQDRLQLYSTRISGTKPVVVTEMGYHDYMDVDAGEHKATDPRAVGVYMPRAYLENFRIGVARTYAYQLYDETENAKEYEKHFGMFQVAGLSRPAKPSANAMRAMNTIVEDTQSGASSFRPSKLDFTIPNKPDDVRYVLLQKRSGKFYLAIWKTTSVYDPAARRYTEPTAESTVTINFARARNVTAYYDNSTFRTAVGSGQTSYSVRVTPKVSILEIQ